MSKTIRIEKALERFGNIGLLLVIPSFAVMAMCLVAKLQCPILVAHLCIAGMVIVAIDVYGRFTLSFFYRMT